MTDTHISRGFADAERPAVAALYWQAFGAKLGKVLGPTDKALAFLTPILDPDYALTARDDAGNLLGVAGFKTEHGALIAGGFGDMTTAYGVLSACWRAALISLLDRPVQPDCLLMDGIFVADTARGQGVGTKLLSAIRDEARAQGLAQVRLDVINTNPRARALYERFGFVAQGTENLGRLRHIFGFSSATRMVLPLADAAE